MRILVTGSIAFDYLMSFPGRFREVILPDRLECLSVSFLVDSLHRRRGGCAANIAYTLALLGERPLLIGAAGEDFAGYGADLARLGVDLRGVLVKPGELTASFFANTDLDGNQICSFYTGAMRLAREIDLAAVAGPEPALAIVSPDDPEAMSRHAAEAKALGHCLLYDPSQQLARLEGEALRRDAAGAWALLVNEYEEELFRQKTGLDRRGLLGLVRHVVVTLGAKGAEVRTPEGALAIPPARPARILDPTGVGDAFRAGLLKGLAAGLPWETAGRMGSLAAAYVLETDGPQAHAFTLAGFAARYRGEFGADPALDRLVAAGG